MNKAIQTTESITHTSSDDVTATGLARAKLATRLSFFVAGFAIACWAPLVPYAQERLHADAATLGSILLCLGLGAVVGMPLAGNLSARMGSRPVIVGGALALFVALPLLAVASTETALGLALLLFGVALGCIDVAANIHGTEVQNAAGVPLMSGFHGMYSVGGLVGATAMTAILSMETAALTAAAVASVVVLAATLAAAPRMFGAKSGTAEHPLVTIPRGVVVIIGLLALVCFLAEGAMLDWSALLLTQSKNVDISLSGSAYVVFALAMTLVRLVGDRLVAALGEKPTLIFGFLFTATGISMVALCDSLAWIYVGMALAGLAVGNIVPILFTLAGKQRSMPATQAIAAASTLGYLGILAGPALIGYAAHFTGLAMAFVLVAVLVAGSAVSVPTISKNV